MDLLDIALRIAQLLFTGSLGLYTLVVARRSASKAESEKQAERMAGQDQRIFAVEQQMLHLPTAQQMSELAGDMRAIQVEITGLAKALDPLTRSVDRINDYLLREKA